MGLRRVHKHVRACICFANARDRRYTARTGAIDSMRAIYAAVALGVFGSAFGSAFGSSSRPPPPPPPPVPMPDFSFGPAFGSNMVLQQAPAKSAVYGYLGDGATAVKVTVKSVSQSYSVDADLNASLHQPFGPEYGVTTFNHYNRSVPGWKALLKPMEAGGDYTITATCTGCSTNATQTISNVAFGDVCERTARPAFLLCMSLCPSSIRVSSSDMAAFFALGRAVQRPEQYVAPGGQQLLSQQDRRGSQGRQLLQHSHDGWRLRLSCLRRCKDRPRAHREGLRRRKLFRSSWPRQ